MQIDLDEDKTSQAFEKAERISNQYPSVAPIQGRLGSVFLGAGLFEEAAARLQRAHQLDSSEPAFALALGEAWLQLGKYQETIDLLAALRPQMAASADLHRLLARAHLGRKDYPAAEREIKQVLAWNADDPESHLLLGSVRLKAGRTQEGLAALAQVLMAEADSLEVHNQEEAGPYLKGRAATVAGVSYLNTERRDKAIEHLQLAVRLAPAVERNYLLLAEIYRERQQFPEASAILETGRKAIPDSTDLLLPLGRSYGLSGDYERATAVLRELIAQAPSQVEAYMPLAQAYESLGNVDEAIEVLQKRSKLPPQDVMVSMAMASFLFSKGEAFFDQVLAKLAEAEQIQASDPDILYWRGRVYRAQERHEEAIQAFTRVLELDPLSERTHLPVGLGLSGRREIGIGIPAV